MSEKEVLLVLTDNWADWEAAYAIVGINEESAYKAVEEAIHI